MTSEEAAGYLRVILHHCHLTRDPSRQRAHVGQQTRTDVPRAESGRVAELPASTLWVGRMTFPAGLVRRSYISSPEGTLHPDLF